MKRQDIIVLQHIFHVIQDWMDMDISEKIETSLSLYYRNNPDGTVRWIWPSKISEPVFLKFYNTSSRRAKFYSGIIRLIFKFKIQRLFASGKLNVAFDTDGYKTFIKKMGDDWCLFTGTAGVNRTALLYGKNQFHKIPVGINALDLVAHEHENLNQCSKNEFKIIEFPHSKFNNNVLSQNDVSVNGRRVSVLTDIHWEALYELSLVKNFKMTLNSLPAWNLIDEKLEILRQTADERIPRGLIRKLIKLKKSLDPKTLISVSYSHGDFTPWNMFVKENKLALIDWELAHSRKPCLFDAFHFLYQQSSLVDHIDFYTLKDRISNSFEHPVAKKIVDDNNIDVNLHHQLYLLFTSVYYLDVYEKQALWHPQVQWSIDIWNDSVNDSLYASGISSQRELVIQDIFDFLFPKNYAALKWLCGSPVNLSDESDIDLAVEKGTVKELKKFLQQHPMLLKLKFHTKSFMTNFSVILKDDTFLSIDAISKFKRKATVMLDINTLISSASLNNEGVKIPAVEKDFEYTWLFYLLNKNSISEKYKSHFHFFSYECRKRMNKDFEWNKKLGISQYEEVCNYNKGFHKIVLEDLKKRKENKGIKKLVNNYWYYIDTVRENFFHRGFIITFSGVDGAGKSTVIEKIKQQIEKKYRRKVIVLRHRPALLPMLSAWSEGREAAEKRAAANLPRQGTNKSFFSSCIRFSYYYIDYLLGQFIVQIKYVSRGYVVLYDRYYFDFINDGKRSNILLPARFIKYWYTFLLKPKFNFFLYADAEVIIKRKKELDKKTITQLTNKYLNLFQQLGDSYQRSKYISIENEELPLTLNTILHHVKNTVV